MLSNEFIRALVHVVKDYNAAKQDYDRLVNEGGDDGMFEAAMINMDVAYRQVAEVCIEQVNELLKRVGEL